MNPGVWDWLLADQEVSIMQDARGHGSPALPDADSDWSGVSAAISVEGLVRGYWRNRMRRNASKDMCQ